MREIELTDGFSLTNCRACVAAAAAAYSVAPTLHTALAHVVIEDCGNAVLVAFRGTKEPADFLTDAECWYSPVTTKQEIGDRHDGCVHHGFWAAINGVQTGVEGRVSSGGSQKPIIVTGHSLGGALAMLCARELALGGHNLHSVYTFGGPRIGDGTWARNYEAAPIPTLDTRPSTLGEQERDSAIRHSSFVIRHSLLGQRTWRLVNQLDIVPRTPGIFAGYRHAGQEVFLPIIGPLRFHTPLWVKLASGLVSMYRDWKHRRLGLLADHHITRYQQRIGSDTRHSTLVTAS